MEAVLVLLGKLASNPTVVAVAFVVCGWALKIGWDVAARWLKMHGARSVADARARVAAAAATEDKEDDALAATAMSRAENEQEILNALADAIESHNPGAVLAKLVRVPGGLPPTVLNLLKNLPTPTSGSTPVDLKR